MFLIIKKTLRGEVQVIKLERTDTTFDQSRSRETIYDEPAFTTIIPHNLFHLLRERSVFLTPPAPLPEESAWACSI